MRLYFKIIIPLCLIALLSACSVSKQQQTELAQLEQYFEEVKILGIKGSGSFPNYGYKKYDGNTAMSIKNALTHLDGAEIDIQLSSEGSFWVLEEATLINCNHQQQSVIDIDDQSMGFISACWFENRLSSLDKILYATEEVLSKEKTLALDLRFLDNATAIKTLGGNKVAVDSVLLKIDRYFKPYEVNVILEVANDSMYRLLKKKSKYDVYHKQEDKRNLDKKGSYIFPIELVKGELANEIKSKDYQITEANSIEDMLFAMNTNAKYIQTQNVPLGVFLGKVDSTKRVDSLLYHAEKLAIDDGVGDYLLSTLKLDDWIDKESFLLSFNLEAISDEVAVFLVFLGENKDGNDLFWESRGIISSASYKKFINVKELKERGVEELKIYIDNQKKESLQLQNIELKLLTY